MKANVLLGNGRSETVEMPIPEIGSTEVLIRVLLCGVCTSEYQTWLADYGKGMQLGHEVVGIVEEIGCDVKGFKKGDRVTGMIYMGYAEYTKADYRLLVKVPDALEDCEALGEPLSCLLSGLRRIDCLPCENAAVIGTGFMGLGMVQLLKYKGVNNVIAVDVRQESRDNSLMFGADMAVHPDEVKDIYKVTDWDQMDRGVEVVIEASGSQKGLDLAGEMTAVHGILAITGYHQGGPRLVNMELWNWKAITVINAHERRDRVHIECQKEGLSLIEKGLFRMKPMITHEFALDELDKAFNVMKEKPAGFIKAVIRMG